MTELLTSAQMRAIEQMAFENGSVTCADLMERAGQGVVEAIFAEWPELRGGVRRAVVLCGRGNNGGDGFVVARVLQARGWQVETYFWGDAEKLPRDARANHDHWAKGNPVLPLDESVLSDAAEIDVVVDALFGIGLSRPFVAFPAVQARLNMLQSDAATRVVAVDVPSGLDADTGCFPDRGSLVDTCIAANLTVTFHAPKIGHFIGDGPFVCGKLAVVDIGLARDAVAQLGKGRSGKKTTFAVETPLLASLAKKNGHKFDHGHALVVSGGMGRTGAARLAARGALRIGAGLVTIGAAETSMMECAAQLTAIMLQRCDDGNALAGILADHRINAVCLGPGLGVNSRAESSIGAALAAPSAPSLVLDADALTMLAQSKPLFDAVRPDCVLTPHGGEFSRLFPEISDRRKAGTTYSKVDAARDAAAESGCIVLFKGPDTVIAAPDGQVAVHCAAYDRAAPWLATAGSGDVLAGVIAGLLARGFKPFDAATTAVWLHVEAARSFGAGLIAEDLPEELPKVLSRL